IGANGVGTLSNVHVWAAQASEGELSFPLLGGTPSSTTLSGLQITSGAFDLFSQSLGLLTIGHAALSSITDYGSLTLTVQNVTLTPPVEPPIPEPSTYALMGVGLVGIGLMARRRRAHQGEH